MAIQENGIIFFQRVKSQMEDRNNKRGPEVAISEDGTACPDQSVPVGTPCYWTGFNKLTGEFRGRPIPPDKLEIV